MMFTVHNLLSKKDKEVFFYLSWLYLHDWVHSGASRGRIVWRE